MRINKNTLHRLIIILTIIFIIVSCSVITGLFHLGDEAAVGLFSLAATLVGTVFIAIELQNSQVVTCCDMLIDQNNYFHDNDHLMKVYSILEESPASGYNENLWKDVQPTDIACYCTFFENLYLLYRNKIARIEDLDDLFGYRFFVFVNNPFVQEHHILPTSSSYNEIFRLYAAWSKFRRQKGTSIPRAEYAFSPAYLEGEYFLHDLSNTPRKDPETVSLLGSPFTVRRLGFEDISDVLRVQQKACEQLADPSLFYPLSREEIIESLHLDTLWGVFSNEGSLAAFADPKAPAIVERDRSRRTVGVNVDRTAGADRGAARFSIAGDVYPPARFECNVDRRAAGVNGAGAARDRGAGHGSPVENSHFAAFTDRDTGRHSPGNIHQGVAPKFHDIGRAAGENNNVSVYIAIVVEGRVLDHTAVRDSDRAGGNDGIVERAAGEKRHASCILQRSAYEHALCLAFSIDLSQSAFKGCVANRAAGNRERRVDYGCTRNRSAIHDFQIAGSNADVFRQAAP